jgi:membrane protease YdiL (CAAX protease family)
VTTPLDRYAAIGARHVRPSWLDSRVGMSLTICLVSLAGYFAARALGMGLAAIPFALAGPLAWTLLLRQGLWRLLVGFVIILFGWLLWTILVMAVATLFNIGQGHDVRGALETMRSLIESQTPAGVMFQLATFAGIWPATWAALKLLHGQPFGTLFSPEARIRWGEFGTGLLLAGGFGLITLTAGVLLVGAPERTDLTISTWLVALGPLALFILFQASGEEIIFRGYILQQLAARYRSPVVWAFLPSFLFGLSHYGNGEALGVGWQYVTVTTLFGLTAAALVWRTGSLAAAMGLHTGMNIFSLSSVGLKGVIEGTQLYLYDGAGVGLLFALDGLATAALLLLILSPLCPVRGRAMA